MSTREWYLYLMEKKVFKVTAEDGSQENVLCRIERKHPDYDWESLWVKLRLPGLSSNVVSFVWKMVHDILTTEERINATLGNIPATCRYGGENEQVANQIHCLFNCSLTYVIGQWLLKTVRIYGPISENDILRFNVPNNSALIWTIATTLHYSWSERVRHKAVDPPSFKAYLEAELLLMKETKYRRLANEISMMIREITL